jgi:hypothetical protein
VWWHLKNKVLEIHPELESIGNTEQAREALKNTLVDTWEAIDSSIIESCLKSIYRRRDAVLKAKGWHTKY